MAGTLDVLPAAVLVLHLVSRQVSALTCYQCTVHPPSSHSNKTTRLCSQFDYSQNFQVDCPYSTFCMKKTFNLELQQGKNVRGWTRDCAPQRYNYQVYKDGKWKMENKIQYSVYSSGCHQEKSLGLKTSTSEYCYCEANLCNGAESSRDPASAMHHTDTMAVIFIFNAMKYIRSLR